MKPRSPNRGARVRAAFLEALLWHREQLPGGAVLYGTFSCITLIEDATIETAGWNKESPFEIRYNPDWFARLTHKERSRVMKHELSHFRQYLMTVGLEQLRLRGEAT